MKRFRDTEYFVSEDGHVYRDGKPIQFSMSGKGYRVFTVSHKGKRNNFQVHRVVAECYIENPENKPQVNHINGKKHDNTVGNLEWVTPQENIDHAHATGLRDFKGESHPYSKITKIQADMIRELYVPHSREFSMNALARKFNVGKSTIWNVINNEHWTAEEYELSGS